MSQSTIIFGALIFGFVVFITVKGELSAYLAILGLGPQKTTQSQTTLATGFKGFGGGADFGGAGSSGDY